MSRKQKIVVSITGIFLVLMILVGLTYAYFLTKITGNTNTKSISVSTANLVLEYGENTNVVQGISNAEPGYEVSKIFTATNKGNNTVTYGAALESIVNELSRQEDLVYTLTCTSYLKDNFSLASNGTITGTEDGTCNGISTETKFPSTSTISIMTTNTIDTTHTQAYKLTITYKEMGVDQSEDMNKTFSAKVNIVDLNALIRTNSYEDNKNSLAYNVINNAMNKTNGTELLAIPKTKVADEISFAQVTGEYGTIPVKTDSLCAGYDAWYVGDSEAISQSDSATQVSSYEEAVGKYINDRCSDWTKYLVSYDSSTSTLNFRTELYDYEKNISIASDDYGTSYYYRGNVIDNYVDFAGMCWRIVRISGDGSIKLILEDQNQICESSNYTGNWALMSNNFGYSEYGLNALTATDGTKNSTKKYLMDYLNGATNSKSSMAYAFKNFQTSLNTKITKNNSNKTLSDYLKVGGWCLNDKVYKTDYTTVLKNVDKLDFQIKGSQLYYDSYVRLNNKITEPTLKCNSTLMTKFENDTTDMYVGTLTVDEIIYAGGKINTENKYYYLINDYQRANLYYWWSFSPSSFNGSNDVIFAQYKLGDVSEFSLKGDNSLVKSRPAVQLKSNIQITGGNGTKENPYEIAS